MTTMQAVVKTARGEGNVALRELPQPRPGPGQVLLAVRAAGICGTDLHIYHDEYPTQPPVVLGHELAGEVVAAGDGVTRVSVGDRVTTETYFHLCGSCRFCRGGQPNLCPERRSIGSGVDGGFAPYVVVPERNIHRLPDNLTFQEAALSEPLACVVHGALELPKVTPGDVAVVAGPGSDRSPHVAGGARRRSRGDRPGHGRRPPPPRIGAGAWGDARGRRRRRGSDPHRAGPHRGLGRRYRLRVLRRGTGGPLPARPRASRRAICPDRTLRQTSGLGSRSGLHEGAAGHRQQCLRPLRLAHGAATPRGRQGADSAADQRRLPTGRTGKMPFSASSGEMG